MTILAWFLCIFNIFFAVISFVPCIMGGAMGMDSPQAQKDKMAIIFCILFLTFPIVCLICGILPVILNYFQMPITAVIFGLWPIFEAICVLTYMYCNESN